MSQALFAFQLAEAAMLTQPAAGCGMLRESPHLPGHLRDQLSRAASSIALNLAEGRGKNTRKEQLRYFHIAMGSTREAQAALILADLESSPAWEQLDNLAASLYRLILHAR